MHTQKNISIKPQVTISKDQTDFIQKRTQGRPTPNVKHVFDK